jgi:hypothetical protein
VWRVSIVGGLRDWYSSIRLPMALSRDFFNDGLVSDPSDGGADSMALGGLEGDMVCLLEDQYADQV